MSISRSLFFQRNLCRRQKSDRFGALCTRILATNLGLTTFHFCNQFSSLL